MTDSEILSWAARYSYARIIIDPETSIPAGQQSWASVLPTLTQEQRVMLEEKIEHFESLVLMEHQGMPECEVKTYTSVSGTRVTRITPINGADC